jgi:hypothetical protein
MLRRSAATGTGAQLLQHRTSEGLIVRDVERIEMWFATNRGRWCDLEFGGRVFGGRYGESPQMPRSFSWMNATLRIDFGTTERLELESPHGIGINRLGALVVRDASEVRWSWHYYGRPQTPENLCIETYRRDRDTVQKIISSPLKRETACWSLAAQPLVVILPWQTVL